MHIINTSKYDLRTDLIIENNIGLKSNHYEKDNIMVDDIIINKKNKLKKKDGKYITISFKDITDHDNFKNVLNIFVTEMQKVLKYLKIKDNYTCLVIGLGNKDIICDALGNRVLKNIIVTRTFYLINNVDKKYRNVSILEPNVIGITGIESNDIITGVIKKIKPDFVIAIDSLCARSIKRLNKTIQITTSGISPGSGIGNDKKELSFDTLKIPVIAIGVPTVVDTITIVSDTFDLLMKKISYTKENIDNNLNKLKHFSQINYEDSNNLLNDEERKEILGNVGLLNNDEIRKLMYEVLEPVNANLIVTEKEVDILLEKLSLLISEGINKSLHNI